MNLSTKKIVQPEQEPNNEQKADVIPSAQVSANAVLAEVPGGLNALSKSIFHKNRIKWNYPKNRNIGEILCLLHSEISEALEADRKNRYVEERIVMSQIVNEKDDEQFSIWYKNLIKGTFEEEMADILIRLLDLCGSKDIDIESHVKAKLRYNFMNGTNGKKY
jgi:hypothetical protein